MSETRGTVSQPFKIRIDTDKLMNFIAETIEEAISKDGFEKVSVEADYDPVLELSGSYETSYKSYYSPATRWEPAEYDLERKYLGGSENYLTNSLPEVLRSLVDIVEIEEVDEDADYQEPEPDEDLAYELWRDRQYED